MAALEGEMSTKEKDRLGIPTGCPSGPRASEALLSTTYFGVTALVPTPPAADFTQTVVGLAATVARNVHLPSA